MNLLSIDCKKDARNGKVLLRFTTIKTYLQNSKTISKQQLARKFI